MFEDLIEKQIKNIPKKVDWDIYRYQNNGAYCYRCGSRDVFVIRDQLKSDCVEKDVRCNFCGSTWREIWNKNIDLELKELQIDFIKISLTMDNF